MKFLLIIPFILLFLSSFSQTEGDPCDSIFVHSCLPNATGIQIEVVVSNHSLDIISYPGFVLLAENGDTIAVEQVNYFGIGWDAQSHILNIINQPSLPSNATLELHSHFYDSLRCSWSVTLGSSQLTEQYDRQIQIFPNPAKDWIQIEHAFAESLLDIQIYNTLGEAMILKRISNRIDVSQFSKGLYYIEYFIGNQFRRSKFLIQ